MIILGIYHSHDAGAALYDDYRLIAAVAQERATRIKSDGGRFPTEAVAECLAQAGLSLSDVEIVALPRVNFPTGYFTARSQWPFPVARRPERELIRAMTRQGIGDPARALDAPRYLADQGLKPARIAFYNHHMAHALGALFHTRQDDALVYTSDGGGDRVYYSARRLKDRVSTELFGGEADSRSCDGPTQGRQPRTALLQCDRLPRLSARLAMRARCWASPLSARRFTPKNSRAITACGTTARYPPMSGSANRRGLRGCRGGSSARISPPRSSRSSNR